MEKCFSAFYFWLLHIPERDSNSTNAKPDGAAHEMIEQTN